MPAADQRHYPTMADVAERAGVSVSTVSRTLRGLSASPDVRIRVERAAHELNFVVSRRAASLVTGKTGAVAVLASTLKTWFLGSAVSSLGSVLQEAGLELLVYLVPDMKERTAFFERLPLRRNADALLVLSFDLTAEEHARLDDLGVPVVYVSQHAPDRPSVYVDDADGARRGTQHLLNLGHRRIAYVRSINTAGFSRSVQGRLTGYRQALADAGLPFDDDLVVATDPLGDRHGTTQAVGELLGLRHPPTAIFAESDRIAMEVIAALRRARIDVPDRISVLGFDDHEMAELMDLSTIAQSPEALGRTAAELIRTLITEPGGGDDGDAADADAAGRTRHVVLPTHLIPRGSTAPLRGAGGSGSAGLDGGAGARPAAGRGETPAIGPEGPCGRGE